MLGREISSLLSLLTARETTGLPAKYLQVSLELLLSQGELCAQPHAQLLKSLLPLHLSAFEKQNKTSK